MARLANKLTEAAVRNLKKPGLYGDGNRLYLQVSEFRTKDSEWQTKSWIFRFTNAAGRERQMGLGAYPRVSLKKARDRRDAEDQKLLDGIDPIEARKCFREQQRVEAANSRTFRWCAEEYIKANRHTWKNPKHAAQWDATFAETRRGKNVYPAATALINDLPVSAVDTGLVIRVLEPIWTAKRETASRIRGRIEKVIDWAKVRGLRTGDNPARWDLLKQALPAISRAKSIEHHPALPYADMPRFMAELRAREGVSARALEFLILTATRTNEIINAKWSEIDLDARLWVIPPVRMKAGKEHRVPLGDRVMSILTGLPREGEFLLVGARKGKPLSNMAMLELLRGLRPSLTVHGFRSTFKDWASEQTSYPNELTEVALAHAVGNKVEAAYRRGDMMQKRRRLMDDWANYCAGQPIAGDNVVSIRGAR